MDGFKKLDFNDVPRANNSTPSFAMKKKRNFKFNPTRRNLIILGVVVFLLLFSLVGIVLPAKSAYTQAKITYNDANMTLAALKKENISDTSTYLATTKDDLVKTQSDLAAMWYLGYIPIANFYYGDATHLLQAGFYSINAGQIFVDAVKPYADVLGLKGKGSFVGGSAQERIQTAVTTMSKVTPKIDDIESQLVLAKKEIDAVDPNHYPPLFGGEKIRTQLSSVKTLADQGVTFIGQAKPLIKVLPNLLGEPDERRYLIIFQNDKELRPTGGFITAYAIFSVSHGVIRVDTSQDIYTLDSTIPNKPVAPKQIQDYLVNVPVWNIRDTNLSPDFPTSMQEFMKLYKTSSNYTPVDGIIALDTHTLVSAMDILGAITTDGTTFTTKINPVCNCADVIYQLELYADKPEEYFVANRKGIVGDLMYAIMQKAFSSSPKLYWGPLFQTMITEVSQKHILFNLFNSDAMQGIEAVNAAGQILPFSGDYLHVNDSNFGGAKSNLFLTESVTQDYSVGSDGKITKTVTINYKNPFPPSDCNLEHGNLCLNAEQRDWLRIYVPKGSQLVSSSGSQIKVTTYDDLGKTVIDGFVTVRPLGQATYTVTYTLPFKLGSGSPLPLLVQKEPGTDGQIYTITEGGRQLDSFVLQTDKTENLHL